MTVYFSNSYSQPLHGNFRGDNEDIFRVIATTVYKCQMLFIGSQERKKKQQKTLTTHPPLKKTQPFSALIISDGEQAKKEALQIRQF